MTALACLRIVIDPERALAGGDALAAMVGKIACAFLDSRWRWPRRYGEIAPYAFLLADPRAISVDLSELVSFSEELQLKLFGTDGGGAICLATLEGDQDAVTRFAAVEPDVLRRVLSDGGTIDGLIGRIGQITPAGVRIVSPPGEAGPRQAAPAVAPAMSRGPTVADDSVETSFRGVWCTLKQSFIGNGLVTHRAGARDHYCTFDGVAEQPGDAAPEFDITCLEAAPHALARSHGLMFLPVSFSSMIHRQTRERYIGALEGLPQAERPRLAAAVYDVPRGPTYAAISQVRAFLKPYFCFVDLQTSDPDFHIDAMTPESVNSITLSLPDTGESGRLAAVTRFMARRDAYRRLHIWPAITNVRTHHELDTCMKLRVPFLSGPAVCDRLTRPTDPISYTTDRMPMRDHHDRLSV